jgi:two-component system, LytTR family, response regulator
VRRLRSLIADDEPLARELLGAMLQAHEDIEVVGECSDGYEVVVKIRRHAPDLIFLDIQMPGLDGFEVIESVGIRQMPLVVFVTAYDHFAVRAFETHAVDYLLKPFDEARLAVTLDRVRALTHGDRRTEERKVLNLLEELHARERHAERLVIRDQGKAYFVRVEDIERIEAEGKYARVHTRQEDHLLKEGLGQVEPLLDPRRFVRIHRSAIVQVARIKEIHRWFKGEYLLVMESGAKLTTGRVYRDSIERLLKGP